MTSTDRSGDSPTIGDNSAASRHRDGVRWLDWFAVATLSLAGIGGVLLLSLWLVDGRPVHGTEGATGRPRLDEAEFARLTAGGTWVGDSTAPVVVLLYNDYRCGSCSVLHATLERLKRRYPQHVAVVYKHFDNSFGVRGRGRSYLVPEGAECAAEQGAFEAYHRSAFANVRVLGYADAPSIIADSAKIPDSSAFHECMDSRRHANAVKQHHQEAADLGVRATPTMFLNGAVIVGALPLEPLDSPVAGELGR